MNRIFFALVAAVLFSACSQQLGQDRTIEGTVKSESSGQNQQGIYVSVLQGNGKEFPRERFEADQMITSLDGAFTFTFQPFNNSGATAATLTAQAVIFNEFTQGPQGFSIPIGSQSVPVIELLEQPEDEPVLRDILTKAYGTLSLEISLSEPASTNIQSTIRIFNDDFSYSLALTDQDLERAYRLPVPVNEVFTVDYTGITSGTPVNGSDTLRIAPGNSQIFYQVDM